MENILFPKMSPSHESYQLSGLNTLPSYYYICQLKYYSKKLRNDHNKSES